MKKKHIITIAGRPGSGKSTASKAIAERLGYEHFSSGDLFRALGKQRGTDVHQTNLEAEKGGDVDRLVDERLQEIGATQDQVAIDSRLAWHWIPSSFKVFLNLDLEVAAERILKGMDEYRRQHEHIPSDPKEYAARLQERLDVERRRYKAIYGVDVYDHNNFHLIIDTGVYAASEVQERILEAYQRWLDS